MSRVHFGKFGKGSFVLDLGLKLEWGGVCRPSRQYRKWVEVDLRSKLLINKNHIGLCFDAYLQCHYNERMLSL